MEEFFAVTYLLKAAMFLTQRPVWFVLQVAAAVTLLPLHAGKSHHFFFSLFFSEKIDHVSPCWTPSVLHFKNGQMAAE